MSQTARPTDGSDDLAFDVFDVDCPSRAVFGHVTGRWGALTLTSLSTEPMRFNEVRRRVSGISEKMLSQTLHQLQVDGLVDRTDHGSNPPRVEYSLTDSGRAIAASLWDLIRAVEGVMPVLLHGARDA